MMMMIMMVKIHGPWLDIAGAMNILKANSATTSDTLLAITE